MTNWLKVALSFSLLIASPLHAQGMMPSKKATANALPPPHSYLFIGDRVPTILSVFDDAGKPRRFLSYKAATDVMVVEFLSPTCPVDVRVARELFEFYHRYKDWRVAFVAVTPSSDQVPALQRFLTDNKMAIPVVVDNTGDIYRLLHATGTPGLVVLDESDLVRYRGPLHDAMTRPGQKPKHHYANDALDTIIGHIDAVQEAEPTAEIGCPL